MALSGRLASLACVLLASACSPFGGGEFACSEDTQCSGGNLVGTCEVDGRCSFPDAACTSGRRYGEFAGDRSNTCVGGEVAPDGPDDPDAAIDAMIDAVVIPFCDPTNATLAGCWEFEGNGTDGSGSIPSNTANTASGAFAIGKVGMGLTLTTTSVIAVGDRATLETPNLTTEAWIRPTQRPATGARMGVMDSDGAYGVFFTDTTVTCTVGGLVATHTVALDAWTHIACSYDGTTGRLYINGGEAVMGPAPPVVPGNANGLVLGGNSPNGDALIGTIDQIRIWNVARTPAQICAAAGIATCP